MSDNYYFLLSSPTDNTVKLGDPDGEFLGNFVKPNAGGINGPGGLALGPDGKLYVGANLGGNVLRYDPITGEFLDVFVPKGSGGLSTLTSIAFGPDGNLYLSNYKSITGLTETGQAIIDYNIEDNVLVFDGQTGNFIKSIEFPDQGASLPLGLKFGPDNNLYIPTRFKDAVYRYNLETGVVDKFISKSSGYQQLKGPADALYGPDGKLYVTSLDGNQILRYNSETGKFIDVFADFTNNPELNGPTAPHFTPSNQLIVTGYNSKSVVLLDSETGEIVEVLVPPGGDASWGFFRNVGTLVVTPKSLGVQPEVVVGTNQDDSLEITGKSENPDQIIPTSKNANGGAGNDTLDASNGAGDDRLYGNQGDDQLLAGKCDFLFGGSGDDTLDGSSGTGKNRLYGNQGDDQLLAGDEDFLDGGSGDDTLDASGATNLNRLYGGEGNDTFLLGDEDFLSGGKGDDTFYVGTDGNNTLVGGSGSDSFWLAVGALPNSSNTIKNFAINQDVIGINGLGITDKGQLSITPDGFDALVSANDSELARLLNVNVSELTANGNFMFA